MATDDPTVAARMGKKNSSGPTRELESDRTVEATPGLGAVDGVQPGDQVGRYQVDRLLGEGGMGVVYLARDPDLDRPVALKLVRYAGSEGSGGSDGRARLLREAQALAKLSHPNVVSIYDVGRYGDGVFLAMEFVDGASLKDWLAAAEREPGAILAALVSAGRGLAAAHDKGLVHRDVKPDNMFRWADGRVAVGDFGLARAELEAFEGADIDDSQPVYTSLTHTGAIMGTPPYMAPEQHSGKGADARSDQFSFCVTAWEALCGQRPFPADNLMALRCAIMDGAITEPPAGRPLPKRIERVLRRGLATDPAGRYPSMDALLAELAPPPRRLPIAWVAGGAAAAAGATAVLALVLLRGGSGDACAPAGDKLAAVWGPPQRAAAAAAFTATGTGYARAVFPRVGDALDGYAARFSAQYLDACEDTRVRREYDDQVLALRNACLDARMAELDSLVRLFTSADAEVARGAIDAVAELRAPERCGDVAALTAAVPLPEDPALRTRVATFEAELGRVMALEQVAKYGAALELIEPLVVATDELGYRPLEARVRLHHGVLLSREGRYDQAEEALRDAVFRAEAGRADELAADAWLELVDTAFERAAYEQAHERSARARAAIERLGNPGPLRADLHNVIAAVHAEEGEWDQAEAARNAALEAIEQSPEAEVAQRRANAVHGLAFIHYRRGELEQALARHRQALALRERTLGPEHPSVADTLLGLCMTHEAAGDFDRALALYDRALAIMENAFGPDHIRLADTLSVIGGTYHALGRHEEALTSNRRALHIREAALGHAHPLVAQNLTNVAIALKNLGRFDEAVAAYADALEVYEQVHGPEHFAVGVVENNLGEALRTMGRPGDALAHYQRSLAVLEAAAGADNPVIAHPLTGLGETHVALGDARAALAPLERALDLRGGARGNPVDLAQTHFALAQALWTTGDRRRALELAGAAEAAYREVGEGRAADAERIAAWRADRR